MLAFKNLARSPLRTLLTVVGVALGVAMLVAISGYGQSIGQQLQGAVSNRYQLIVQSGDVSSPLSSRITPDQVLRLQQIPGIESLRPIVAGSVRTTEIPYFLVVGVTAADLLYGNVNLIEGGWEGLRDGGILLGRNAAQRFGVAVGGQLQLRAQVFEVTAVFSSESNILNHAGIVSLNPAQRLLGRGNEANLVLLKIAEGQPIRPVMRRFAVELPTLQMSRSADLFTRLELFIVIEKVTTSLSLIAILFCVLIVSNTLLMSLAERKRDIGILLAIGWNRWMIARSLFGESLAITLSGSLLGIALGAAILRFYSQSNVAGINWGTAELPAAVMITALLMSIPMALLGAIYPVILSSRWSPVGILRRE